MAVNPLDPNEKSQLGGEAGSVLKNLVEDARQMRFSAEQFEQIVQDSKTLRSELKRINGELDKQEKGYDKIRKLTSLYANDIESAKKYLKDDVLVQKSALELRTRMLRVNHQILDVDEQINRMHITSDQLEKHINKNLENRRKLLMDEKDIRSRLIKQTKDLEAVLSNADNFGGRKLRQSAIDDIIQFEDRKKEAIEKLAEARNPLERANAQRSLTSIDSKYLKALDEVSKRAKDESKEKIDAMLAQQFAEKNIVRGIQAEVEAVDLTNKRWTEQVEIMEEIEDKIGVIGKFMDAFKTTRIGQFADFDEVAEAMKGAAKLGQGNMGILGAGGNALLKGAAGKILGPATLLKTGWEFLEFMVSSMGKADKRVTDLARSFGISKDEAQGLYDVMETRLDHLGLSMDDIVGAQLKFNETFGLAIPISRDLNEQLALASKLIGLSEEAQKGLSQNSIVAGEQASEYMKTISGTSKLEQFRNKLFLNNKQILDKVLSTTGGIRANFKGQVAELTRAVTTAMTLGTTLEQVSKFGESLLDFEKSIDAELQAELITGRMLNLERARGYALMGDMEGLTNEMVEQMGGLDEFFKSNVIQQKALAEAFGMSRDEAADALYQKAMNEKVQTMGLKKEEERLMMKDKGMRDKYIEIMKDTSLSEEQRAKMLGEEVQKSLKQANVQDKFAATMERVQEKIAMIFGNGQTLDKLADALIRFLRFFGLIDSKVMTSDEQSAKSLSERNGVSKEDAAFLDDYSNRKFDKTGWLKTLLSTPVLGDIVGGQLVAPLIREYDRYQDDKFERVDKKYNPKKVNDGLISPRGQILISTPMGDIVPSPSDSLITTTNPSGLLNGNDPSSLIAAIKQLEKRLEIQTATLAQVFSQTKDVYMDSTKVSLGIKGTNYKVG